MSASQKPRRPKLQVVPDAFPGATRADRGPKPSRSDKIDALAAENEELRAAMETEMDMEQWGKHAPQNLRDQFAASALIAAELHPQRALSRLGFKIEDHAERKRVAAEIFDQPGVQAILNDDSKKFAGKKDTVMAEMYAIVRTGDPDQKIRAAGQLAKMIDGWQDGEKVKNPGAGTMNLLMQIVGGASANGAPRVVGSAAIAELPPGEEIIDADSFFVDRGDEAVAVVDDPK